MANSFYPFANQCFQRCGPWHRASIDVHKIRTSNLGDCPRPWIPIYILIVAHRGMTFAICPCSDDQNPSCQSVRSSFFTRNWIWQFAVKRRPTCHRKKTNFVFTLVYCRHVYRIHGGDQDRDRGRSGSMWSDPYPWQFSVWFVLFGVEWESEAALVLRLCMPYFTDRYFQTADSKTEKWGWESLFRTFLVL
jgi:hypothetical protein